MLRETAPGGGVDVGMFTVGYFCPLAVFFYKWACANHSEIGCGRATAIAK